MIMNYFICTKQASSTSCQRISDIIYKELVTGIVRDDSKRLALECIDDLRESGAEGIVLGCTELPFLIQQKDTSLPVFDSTVLHAHKALELALEKDVYKLAEKM